MAHQGPQRMPCGLSLLKLVSAACFAAALFLAPQPVFAQHGGGGGGGGGHSGGGGGGHSGSGGHSGGGHSSGGMGGHSSSGTFGGQSSSYTGIASSSHGSGRIAAGSGASSSHAWYGPSSSTNRAFADYYAVGHNTWQEPPSPTGTRTSNHFVAGSGPTMNTPSVAAAAAANRHGAAVSTGSNHFVMTSRDAATRTNVPRNFLPNSIPIGTRPIPLPPHIGKFPPGRTFQPFLGGGCFGGFFPGSCGGGIWWGGGWSGLGGDLGWDYGSECDPTFGCGYGDYSGGYGDYMAGYASGDTYSIEAQGEDMQSQEPNPSIYEPPPRAVAGGQEAAPAPEVALFLKDGSVYAISDYWLAGGRLHYVTNYGGENALDVSQIDLQRTVDANARRGVSFILRPAPPAPDSTREPEPDR
jgi:hypothetical protein